MRESGFTLLEVLVALAIFAVASMIAYRGLDAVTSTKSALDQEIRFWRELGLVFDRMENDFLQSVAHPLAGGQDVLMPPVRGGSNTSGNAFFVELARQDGNRSPIQILYYCEHGELTLGISPIRPQERAESANAVSDQAQITHMLRSIERCEVAFLNAGNAWLSDWPGEQSLAKPQAIRIRLAFPGRGQFERVFLTP